jgi:nucleoside-diphosphate-sugar epimerase
MPRILIAGCGYVGQATAALFHKANWEVEGWTLSADSASALQSLPFTVRAVDLADRNQVRAAGRKFDWIIHCASSGGGDVDHYRRVYFQGTRNLLESFADARLLFTSSTSVYAQSDGSWVDESAAAEPVRDTGKILRQTEQLVLEVRGVVARLAGIYGPGRSALLQRFLAGEAVIDSQRDRFVNQIHRDDVARAIFALVREGASEIYNVVDDLPVLLSGIYLWLARELDRPAPRKGHAAAARKRGQSNKRVSNAKLRELGWQPHFPSFVEAMRESILPSQKDAPRPF